MQPYCEKCRKKKEKAECLKPGTMLEKGPWSKRTQTENQENYFLHIAINYKRLPKRPYQFSA